MGTSCSKYSKVAKSKDPVYKLQKADEYYAKKEYKKAQQLYEELFPLYKGEKNFESLYYKWAFTYYYMKMYPEAQNFFKGFLETFPNSDKAEEIDYMRAYSFYKQSPRIELEQVNTLKAMNMMQTFINQHPSSPRVEQATAIIDEARLKLEDKEYRAAKLYYQLSQYRASAIAFSGLVDNYPESVKGEEYNLYIVKSYYKFANQSIYDKKAERFEQVIKAYNDFADRHPESKLLKEAADYSKLSTSQINEIKNEQITSSAKL